jgi:hypothetical protein
VPLFFLLAAVDLPKLFSQPILAIDHTLMLAEPHALLSV